jgi:hypothetical protein
VGQSVRPATREEKMETLLKFAKELLPLLQLYPGWAKLLFTACALMCAASVATFAVLYQDAEKRMDERTVASDLSVNLGVLTQPARARNSARRAVALTRRRSKWDRSIDRSAGIARIAT